MRIVAVVDVAIKAASAVKPRASADEYTAGEPIGAVVTVRSAVVRSIVEVPIGAHRRHSNVDGDLGWGHGNTAYEGDCEGGESKNFTVGHNLSFDFVRAAKEKVKLLLPEETRYNYVAVTPGKSSQRLCVGAAVVVRRSVIQ
jgi:hypothetical protein